MGWMTRVFSRKGRMDLNELGEKLRVAASKTGIAVTWQTALQAGVSLACVKVIAEGIAQVPFKVYREVNGRRALAKTHPLYDLLGSKPNDWQTSFEFREQLALHAVFAGNAYVWINRVAGKVLELLPLEPGWVTPVRTGWALSYRVSLPGGEFLTLPAEEIWHIRGLSWDGWNGLDGVKLAREAIGLALATEEHGARVFSNGARPGGILTTEQTLTEEQRTRLKKAWNEAQQGVDKAHSTAVMFGGMKFIATAFQNDQTQFVETRRLQVEEVCRHFRVMPIMVGYSDKTATYSSAEQMFQAHVTHTLGPWYARLEQSADCNLLTETERRDGYYTRFVVNALLRGTMQARAEFYRTMHETGVMNANEIRALEEQDAYDGGDAFWAPLNFGTVGKDGQINGPVALHSGTQNSQQ
ncbi:phage portal protein [Andreprevotia chitinilytica]|uniref:phage portal protein n=1 Tax=Andreprevotia chitinilytica TaxID=396808 RepID=UPI0009FD2B45|nr:phage portal protein [Andreprevotia chitinilytica]